ncbi:MAG TPA: hypothetical protein VFL13_01935 [Candidatus Baltobacteraceae bacterium]|nr:hypothetical protein [Candidatus Baltobacteraceae bacterium]
MTRLFRTTVLAALVALCTAVHAEAALDPARVFHPGSGSFLPPFAREVHTDSPLAASLFYEALADAEQLPAPQFDIAAYAGSGTINLSFPESRATFEPALTTAVYTPPAVPSQSLSVATPAAVNARPIAAVSDPLTVAPQAPRFGSYTPYTPGLALTGTSAAMPVRLGNVRFETAFAAMQHCGTADASAACAQGLAAGTAFNVRAGNRALNLRIESGITHVSTNQTAGVFPYVPLDPDAQAGLTYAGVSNVSGQNVGAELAVPVTHRITVGLQFDRTHYQGTSFMSELPGFEGMRDTYLGNLTYQLPGSSAITLSARQYRYQDLLTPNLNATQTRADLNFTVKF